MPTYDFKCPYGITHTFELFLQSDIYKRMEGLANCPIHNLISKRTYEEAPAALNANGSGGYHTTRSDAIQLGRTFTSAKEQDEYAESLGLAPISRTEHERGSYISKGDDIRVEGETRQDVFNKKKASEQHKKEIYSTIRAAGGVTANNKLYQLNEKNQLQSEDGRILHIKKINDGTIK